MLKQRTLLNLVMLAALPLSSIACASTVILHPLTDRDIKPVEVGDVAKFRGWFFSDYYLDQVMKVKIEKSRGR